MSAVIEIEGLRKEYRRLRAAPTLAIDGLDLSVPAGGVFGFLGPNGSGKTTTIRCLLGLINASGGRTRMLGSDVPARLDRVLGRIGAIVETPTLFPTFTGRRNLELLGRIQGIGRDRVQVVLERVDLAERADEIVKHYSLGMKQRLGIASALLRDPELLILDEPANGLDPAGIKEVRDLMRTLAEEGRTVFVSSHILSEVQQTCDRVAILARGRCVAAGPVGEVLTAGRRRGVLVRVQDPAKAADVLGKARFEATVRGDLVAVAVDPDDAATVTKTLASKRIYLSEMRPDEVDLETVFLELTGPQESPE
ncbi:MAG TPA: ABC transporter ATP-binding protein [Actinomycetota bacterium]